MATHVNPKAGLVIKYDGVQESIDGSTPLIEYYDLASPYNRYSENQAASTAYADITLGALGWTNASFLALKNLSATTAEVMNIAAPPQIVAGGTDDGTFDGGALGNTLTGAGYYKTCTVAGASQSKTWAVGDVAVYLGSSGVYLQYRPQKFKLRKGQSMLVEMNGVNAPLRFNSASGTPQLQKVAAGALV